MALNRGGTDQSFPGFEKTKNSGREFFRGCEKKMDHLFFSRKRFLYGFAAKIVFNNPRILSGSFFAKKERWKMGRKRKRKKGEKGGEKWNMMGSVKVCWLNLEELFTVKEMKTYQFK